jgi:hypothetical protein
MLFTKKNKVIITLLAIAVMCIVVFKIYYKPVRAVHSQASYMGFESADELIAASDLIIIGKPLKGFMDRDHTNTRYDSGDIQDTYTKTELELVDVLKMPKNEEFSSEEIIEIIEPVGLVEYPKEKVILRTGDYFEMVKGKRYIIFLQETIGGAYCVINMSRGVFNIDTTTVDEEERGMEERLVKQKAKLKKEVLEVYADYIS